MKKRALDAARHKSCHRGECEGGASSLFWQQTKASIPSNLLLEKIGTSCCQDENSLFLAPSNFLPSPAVCVSCVVGVENEGDDPLDWLRSSIPGEPGTDYPIMASTQVSRIHILCFYDFQSLCFQDSGFSCDGLVFGGYYADPATDCQQYSVCLQDPISPDTLYPVNFLCPNGTIFNQQLFNCDWWSVSFLLLRLFLT